MMRPLPSYMPGREWVDLLALWIDHEKRKAAATVRKTVTAKTTTTQRG